MILFHEYYGSAEKIELLEKITNSNKNKCLKILTARWAFSYLITDIASIISLDPNA
jgi:hypothetical protein